MQHEGAFAWIAANFLLDRFVHNDSVHRLNRDGRTVGIVILDREDLLVAFEMANVTNLPEELAVGFKLGCLEWNTRHNYMLYVAKFAKFGITAARRR